MKLLLENWREYLNENKNVFYVNIHHLVPSEELGHGKEHECPSQKCDDIVQNKMHQKYKNLTTKIKLFQIMNSYYCKFIIFQVFFSSYHKLKLL